MNIYLIAFISVYVPPNSALAYVQFLDIQNEH